MENLGPIMLSRASQGTEQVPGDEESPTALVPVSDPGVISTRVMTTWKDQLAKLSTSEREIFLSFGANGVISCAKQLEEVAKSRGEKSHAAKVARHVRPLFRTMNLYAPIAQTMTQIDPTSSSLVLGGITCIMSISSRFLDLVEKIPEKLSDMVEKLEILQTYGAEIYCNNEPIQQAIFNAFSDILDFCSRAWSLLYDRSGKARGSLKPFLTSLVKSFDTEFGPIVEKFEHDIQVFEQLARLSDRRQATNFWSQQLESSKRQEALALTSQSMIAGLQLMRLDEFDDHKAKSLMELQDDDGREYAAKMEKRQKIISWLPSVDYQKDQEEKSEKRLPKTGTWLLDHYKYRKWLYAETSALLWVQGIHGCGKSYLASLVIEKLSEDLQKAGNSTMGFAFLYCNPYLEQLKPSNLLGSILKQLCHCLPPPDVEMSLQQMYDRQGEGGRLGSTDLKQAILSILGRFSKTFIVIDGLDECHELGDELFEDMCSFIHSLTVPRREDSSVKVIVLSRPGYASIEGAFGACACIFVDSESNQEDILRFIEAKISSSNFPVDRGNALFGEIKEQLLSRADGMFLWVALAVNSLKGSRRPRDIKEKIKGHPQGLNANYERFLHAILSRDNDNMKLTLNLLLWVTNATRPLHRDELLEALAIEPGMTRFSPDDRLFDNDLLASDCADLLYLDRNNCYQLIHSSLKDYLRGNLAKPGNVSVEYYRRQEVADRTLLETCLTYLKFEQFDSGPAGSEDELDDIRQANPFLDYAVMNWGIHAAAIPTLDEELANLIKEFVLSRPRRDLLLQIILFLKDGQFIAPLGETTALHLLSVFDLVEIAKIIPQHDLLALNCDNFGYPVDYAFLFGSRNMCNWILGQPFYANRNDRLPGAEYSWLHAAADYNWQEILERFICQKWDIERRYGPDGRTPLQFASASGSFDAAEVLLQAKANINVDQDRGRSPLLLAATHNHTRISQALISKGADVTCADKSGRTALHYAVEHGDATLAKLLLEKGADCNSVSRKGWRPIHSALHPENTEVLELLIRSGADIEASGGDGMNIFLLACLNGRANCLSLLLESNARLDAHTDLRENALHLAAAEGHVNVIQMLWEKMSKETFAMLSQAGQRMATPLHQAAGKGQISAARLLLDLGADVDTADSRGQTPLMWAIAEREYELAIVLLEDFQASPNFACLKKGTPLHHAASVDCGEKLIKLLMQLGADPEARDVHGWKPLHVAVKYHKMRFITVLMDTCPALDISSKTNSEETVLHIAAQAGNLEFLESLHQFPGLQQETDPRGSLSSHHATGQDNSKMLKRLVGSEAINSRGWNGQTALFAAASEGHLDVVQHLLALGADPNTADDQGVTPLVESINRKHLEIASVILDHEADPNLATKFGRTPFHAAATYGDRTILEKLVNLGCDVQAYDDDHYTPFHYALRHEEGNIMEFFLRRGIGDLEVSTRMGMNALHLIANFGDIDRLEKVKSKLSPDSLTAVDVLGLNAVGHAARAGHAEMADQLIAIGVPPLPSEPSRYPLLHTAAENGFVDTVKSLIKHGHDVNMREPALGMTPLHAAGLAGNISTFKILLGAGADPDLTDSNGITAIELFSKNAIAWRELEWHAPLDPVVPIKEHLAALRRRGLDILSRVLESWDDISPRNQTLHQVLLEHLAGLLLEFDTPKTREAAGYCLIHTATVKHLPGIRTLNVCRICRQPIRSGKFYICQRHGSDNALCDACFLDYCDGPGGNAQKSLMGLQTLQWLEERVRQIRNVVNSFSFLGIDLIGETGAKIHDIWIKPVLKVYARWLRKYNRSGHFDEVPKPGYLYLRLLADAQDLEEVNRKSRRRIRRRRGSSDMESGNETDDERSLGVPPSERPNAHSLSQELKRLKRMFPADQETKRFDCENHDYLELPAAWSLSESQRANFDSNMNLKKEWLAQLRQDFLDAEDSNETQGLFLLEGDCPPQVLEPSAGNTSVAKDMKPSGVLEVGGVTSLPAITGHQESAWNKVNKGRVSRDHATVDEALVATLRISPQEGEVDRFLKNMEQAFQPQMDAAFRLLSIMKSASTTKAAFKLMLKNNIPDTSSTGILFLGNGRITRLIFSYSEMAPLKPAEREDESVATAESVLKRPLTDRSAAVRIRALMWGAANCEFICQLIQAIMFEESRYSPLVDSFVRAFPQETPPRAGEITWVQINKMIAEITPKERKRRLSF